VVYLGWISVAAIASITALLVHHKWAGGPLSEAGWSIAIISIASLLGMIFTWKK
jgi:hypothetical protein